MRFAEAMRSLYPDEIDFLRGVDRVEAEVSTTLGRVVQNPERRALLGFEQRDGQFFLRYDPDDILPLLERLFHDLATETENVTNLRDRTYIDDYVARILRELGHDAVRLGAPISIQEWLDSHGESESEGADDVDDNEGPNDDPDDSTGGDDSGGTTRRRRRREERHIFQGITLSYVDLRVSNVLKEAQKLNIDSSPNLCAIMLRVLLDLTTSSFYAHLGRTNADNTEFKTKIRTCANFVNPAVDDPDLARARLLADSDGALSPKTMNGFVHGWSTAPLASDVRALSAAYGPLLVKIDEYMLDHPHV